MFGFNKEKEEKKMFNDLTNRILDNREKQTHAMVYVKVEREKTGIEKQIEVRQELAERFKEQHYLLKEEHQNRKLRITVLKEELKHEEYLLERDVTDLKRLTNQIDEIYGNKTKEQAPITTKVAKKGSRRSR